MIVDKMNFDSAIETTCDELFSGFDDIKAITYSYDLNFISRIMSNFKTGHIVLGAEMLTRKDIKDIMAHQKVSFDLIKKHKELVKLVEDGSLHFSVLKDNISHAKVFLLSSADGSTRVISGSANMTRQGMDSAQIENIMYCDDKEYYETCLKRFEMLSESSVDDYTETAFVKETTELDEEIPLFNKLKTQESIPILVTTKKEADADIEIDIYTDNLKNVKTRFSSSDEEEDNALIKALKAKKGVVTITKKLAEMVNAVYKSDDNQETKISKQLPKFDVNCDSGEVMMNGSPYDLSVDREKVLSDIKNLETYMTGFEDFTGNTTLLKKNYYKLLNYMFLSPFFGAIRSHAFYYDFPLRSFPIYAIVYGDSDAGKTSFVRAVQRLMFGKDYTKLTTSDFCTKTMANLKAYTYGFPILIDDVETSNFTSAGKIVKHDDNLIKTSNGHTPVFILTSNKVSNVAPEISKRMFIAGVHNRISREVANENERKIIKTRKDITNNLYKYYLSIMMPKINSVLEDMEKSENKDDVSVPDIYKISAGVLSDIYKEFNIEVPTLLSDLSVSDYTGDAAIAENAKTLLMNRAKYAVETFSIDKKRNTLVIDFSEDEPTSYQKTSKCLLHELPPALNCKLIGRSLVLNLSETESFINKKFFKRFGKLKVA